MLIFSAPLDVASGVHALTGNRSTAVGCRHRGAYRSKLEPSPIDEVAAQVEDV